MEEQPGVPAEEESQDFYPQPWLEAARAQIARDTAGLTPEEVVGYFQHELAQHRAARQAEADAEA